MISWVFITRSTGSCYLLFVLSFPVFYGLENLFCMAFRISYQFIIKVPRISSVHLVRCFPLLQPFVSLNIKSFSMEFAVHIMCLKYFSLLVAKISRECLGLI